MVVWEQNDENMVHLENSITIVQNTRHIILRLFLLQKLKSKWKATYKYTSYGIAMYGPSLAINHAIRAIASDLGYENFTGVPKIKTYPFANKDYETWHRILNEEQLNILQKNINKMQSGSYSREDLARDMTKLYQDNRYNIRFGGVAFK